VAALATGLTLFFVLAAALSLLAPPAAATSTRRRLPVLILSCSTLLLSTAAIALSKTGDRASDIEWQLVLLLALFTLLIALVSAAYLRQIAVLGQAEVLERTDCSHLSASRVGRVLSPVRTVAGFLRTWMFWAILPFVIVAVTKWLIGQPEPASLSTDQIATEALRLGALAAIVEEWFFRWLPLFFVPLFLGRRRGLFAVATVLWVVAHPFARLQTGVPIDEVGWGLLGWSCSAIFYYKVWRGPFFWTAFPVHLGTNVAIILANNAYGVP